MVLRLYIFIRVRLSGLKSTEYRNFTRHFWTPTSYRTGVTILYSDIRLPWSHGASLEGPLLSVVLFCSHPGTWDGIKLTKQLRGQSLRLCGEAPPASELKGEVIGGSEVRSGPGRWLSAREWREDCLHNTLLILLRRLEICFAVARPAKFSVSSSWS